MKIISLILTFCILATFDTAVAKTSPLRKSKSKVVKSSSNSFKGGKIYELNSEQKKLLFTMNAQLKTPAKGVSVFSSSYIDDSKNEIMTEEALFESLNLQKYIINQKQLNEIYELEILDGKLHFSVTKNSITEKKIRDMPESLVIGPSFVPFLKLHWSEIQNLNKVKADLAVLDYMDTFKFVFEKLRDEKLNGEEAVIVRMKPNNTLVSSVVRPVYFVVNADGSKILSLKGRMLPKLRNGQRWEDFEGEAVFSY